jgi:hypothetical protein
MGYGTASYCITSNRQTVTMAELWRDQQDEISNE